MAYIRKQGIGKPCNNYYIHFKHYYTLRGENVSLYITFNTYEQVIEFLKHREYPTCFKVNYLPNSDEYALWIGNQPYESYEEIIDDLYYQLNKARDKNNKLRERNDYLDALLYKYRSENESVKNRMQFEAGFNEKLQERIEQLEKGYKDILSWGDLGSTYSSISATITFQDIARKTLVGYKGDK